MKLKLGVVGLRYGETAIGDLLNSPDAEKYELTKVFDLDREKVARVSEKYNVRGASSLEEMLQDGTVDVIGLFTPPAGRAKLLEQILLAGKDDAALDCFEMDPDEAERVLELSRKKGRVLHVNSPGICESGVLSEMRSYAEKYDFGQPVGARCDVWVNYHEKADGGWYDDPEKCPVAPVFRLGIYIINDLIRLFGKPSEVSVLSSRISTGRPTPDNSQLSMLFENGALANIYASFCVDDGQRYKGPMIINYERGTFYYNVFPHQEQRLTAVRKMTENNPIQEEWNICGFGSGHYYWDIFYENVQKRQIIPQKYEAEILWGVKVLRAMKESSLQGRKIIL